MIGRAQKNKMGDAEVLVGTGFECRSDAWVGSLLSAYTNRCLPYLLGRALQQGWLRNVVN